MGTLLLAMMPHVEAEPNRPAIIDQRGRFITYSELERRSDHLADAWSEDGLRYGMRVLVTIRPSIDFYVSMLALWRIGASAIFPEPFTGLAGVRHAARELEPDAILSTGAIGMLLRFVPETARIRMRLSPGTTSRFLHGITVESPDEPALYSFTGGSTGTPKCIERSHRFMLAQNDAISPLLSVGEGHADLCWFPVFVFACLAAGTTAVLPNSDPKRPDRPNTRAMKKQMQEHGVTRLLAPPAVALAMGKSQAFFSTVFTGGGPVFPQDMPQIAAMAHRAYVVYGSTEAEPIAVLDLDTVGPAELLEMCDGGGILAGEIVEQADVMIVDDEILVAGPHVVESYLDGETHDTKLEIDGRVWHRTGDGGRIDEDGRLWLRGRLKGKVRDLWPFEVEAQAREIDGVTGAVLMQRGDDAVVGLDGDFDFDGAREEMAALGVDDVVKLGRLPMDRRHGSRIDYAEVKRVLAASSPTGALPDRQK